MRRRVAAIAVLGALLLLLLLLGAGLWSLFGADPPPRRPAARRSVDEPEPDDVRTARSSPQGPTDEVACEVGRALEGRRCHLRLGPPDWPIPSTVHGDYDGSTWRFQAPAPTGRAELRCRGLEDPVPLRWSSTGACVFTGRLPVPADAPLFGVVDGAADLPDRTVFLEGCGAHRDDPVDADGAFFVLTGAGPCSMRAWRRAGKLKLPGPWVETEAVAGVEVEVELSVPTFEPAGLGVKVQSGGEGIEITAVFEGSPAAAVGIEAGDLLTAIDGVPVDGMGPAGFLELGVGPAGTTVHVEGVDADGEPFEATIRREIIPPAE